MSVVGDNPQRYETADVRADSRESSATSELVQMPQQFPLNPNFPPSKVGRTARLAPSQQMSTLESGPMVLPTTGTAVRLVTFSNGEPNHQLWLHHRPPAPPAESRHGRKTTIMVVFFAASAWLLNIKLHQFLYSYWYNEYAEVANRGPASAKPEQIQLVIKWTVELFTSLLVGNAVDERGNKLFMVLGFLLIFIATLMFGITQGHVSYFIYTVVYAVGLPLAFVGSCSLLAEKLPDGHSRRMAFGAVLVAWYVSTAGHQWLFADPGTHFLAILLFAALALFSALVTSVVVVEPKRQRRRHHHHRQRRRSGLFRNYSNDGLLCCVLVLTVAAAANTMRIDPAYLQKHGNLCDKTFTIAGALAVGVLGVFASCALLRRRHCSIQHPWVLTIVGLILQTLSMSLGLYLERTMAGEDIPVMLLLPQTFLFQFGRTLLFVTVLPMFAQLVEAEHLRMKEGASLIRYGGCYAMASVALSLGNLIRVSLAYLDEEYHYLIGYVLAPIPLFCVIILSVMLLCKRAQIRD